MVVNNLKQLGHGLSNTETVFIQGKWTEWAEILKSIIPSNIKIGVIVTHVFENFDSKSKTLDRIEAHHTNSILVQKYDLAENLSNVSIDAYYNFDRKNHRSNKGSTLVLPDFYLKRGSAKRLRCIPVKNREKCVNSSLYSLVWAHAWITKGKQRVPSGSGFYKHVSKPDLD